MKIEKRIKRSFTVIGKEGSTKDGEDFIDKLWEDANAHFAEIAPLIKMDGNGAPVGVWGAMSDFSRSFKPWEDFSEGLYLAGAECIEGAEAPAGWVKWVIPTFEYLVVENDDDDVFDEMLKYLEDKGLTLAGAVHDFTNPQTGVGYLYFPIKAL